MPDLKVVELPLKGFDTYINDIKFFDTVHHFLPADFDWNDLSAFKECFIMGMFDSEAYDCARGFLPLRKRRRKKVTLQIWADEVARFIVDNRLGEKDDVRDNDYTHLFEFGYTPLMAVDVMLKILPEPRYPE